MSKIGSTTQDPRKPPKKSDRDRVLALLWAIKIVRNTEPEFLRGNEILYRVQKYLNLQLETVIAMIVR
jgi:hypothetical protein